MPSYEKFIGHKVHKLDSKNRVSIPAYMRTDLGSSFYITFGDDNNCLAIRTKEGWIDFMEKLQSLPSKTRRIAHFRFVANAEELSLDPNGRIILSENMRNKIRATAGGEVVIYGCDNRIEIWNKEAFFEELNAGDDLDWTAIYEENNI